MNRINDAERCMRESGALRMSPWQGFRDRRVFRCSDAPKSALVPELFTLACSQVVWWLTATPQDRAESREIVARR